MIPATHRGKFAGPNRLWFDPKSETERSDGTLEVEERAVRYQWSYRGEKHEGEIRLFGPVGAVRVDWKDSFHAKKGMALYGPWAEGQLVAYGTYSAGDSPEWGWRIELDTRDPEHFVMRMFNILPDGLTVQAVDLRGARA